MEERARRGLPGAAKLAAANSRAVGGEAGRPAPLADALHNMAVMDAVFRSARGGAWEVPAA